jgi:hypothetical protein
MWRTEIEKDLQRFKSSKVVLAGGIGVHEPLVFSGKLDSLRLLWILGYIEQTRHVIGLQYPKKL